MQIQYYDSDWGVGSTEAEQLIESKILPKFRHYIIKHWVEADPVIVEDCVDLIIYTVLDELDKEHKHGEIGDTAVRRNIKNWVFNRIDELQDPQR